MSNPIKIILSAFLLITIIGCNGDTFNKYKESRNESGNPVLPDTEAPQIVSATATDKDKLTVVFNEELDPETALNSANYYIQGNNRVNVLDSPAPVFGAKNKTVTLTLSTGLLYSMQNGREYTLLVQRVGDLRGNYIFNELAVFTGRGPVIAEIWMGITPMPSGPPYLSINSGSVEFTIKISGAPDGNYSYSIDGGMFSGVIDTNEPIFLSGLSEGYHSLKVIGENNEGEWQDPGQATTTEFLVDTVPPIAVLSHVPPNLTSMDEIAVMVGGDGVTDYSYRINSSSWSAYINVGTAITMSGLADGEYTLYVRGRDAAGNEQTFDTTASWTVSTSAPVAVLSNGPPRYTRLRSATFTVSGNEVYYYKFKINNDPWSDYLPVNEEIVIENLADGDYTIYVLGSTMANNPDADNPVSYEWTVDNVAPQCIISNLPKNPTNSQTTNIIVSSARGDVVSYRYRLISGGVQGAMSGVYPVSASIVFSALPENNYTIKVIGIDSAGNVQDESMAAEGAWSVDISPPRAVISGVPDVNTAVNDLDVEIGPPDAVAYKYLLDTGQWSSEIPVSVNIVKPNLADGYHTLSVVVRDNAGNWQSLQDPAEYMWQIDTVPPVVVLSNTPAPVTSSQQASIAVAGAGVVSYKYSLDTEGPPWSREYARIEFPNIILDRDDLPEGDHTIYVTGVDLAGNWQVFATSYTWKVNLDTPAAELNGTPNESTIVTNNPDVNITVSAVESYKYKLDGDAWTGEIPAVTPIVISDLPDGVHYILVIGKNAYGQWQEADSATRLDWTIDTIAPMAELSGKPPNPTSSQSAEIKVSGIGVHSYKASLDDPDPRGSTEVFVSDDDTISLLNLDARTHTIYVIARDEAGNWQDSDSATTYTWQVDTSVPAAVFDPETLPLNPASTGSVAISVGGSGVISYKYRLDSASSWSGELGTGVLITRAGLSAGAHTVYAVGKNSTCTWQSESSPTTFTWTIDFTAPSASDILLGNLPDDPTANGSINISVGGPGIEYYQYKINDEDWSADIPVGINIERSGMPDNIYTLYVTGRDAAGNWTLRESAKTYTWTIDQLNPVAAITNRPDDPTNVKSTDFIIAGTGIIEYKYSLDGGSWSEWTDIVFHIGLNGLSDGSHTISVCGRKSELPGFEQEEVNATIYTWTIDSEAPVAILGDLPEDHTLSNSVNVTVGGSGVTAYRYRMDGGSWVPASSEIITEFPVSITGLSYGSHTLEVIGCDLADNWQSLITPSSYTWTIDPPPLVSPAVYDGGDSTGSASITFSWVRPYGTSDVKIQVASDIDFSNIVYEAIVGNSDYYNFIVTDTEIQTYFARVSVNSASGMPAGDPGWEEWGEPSDGIFVTGSVAGSVYDAITRTGLEGVDVEIRRMDNSQLIDSVTTDLNGGFAFTGIPVGTNFYRIISSAAGYTSASRNNVTIALGSETNVGIQYVVPVTAASGTISGRSLDANDAAMLPGTTVRIYDWQNTLMDTQTTLAGDGDPYDPDDEIIGTFESAILDPGIYSVEFTRTGYYTLLVDNVVVNRDIDISNQAICAHLVEPQVRVIVLWGPAPADLDIHLVGPTSVAQDTDPSNRFHVYYGADSFDESSGTYSNDGDIYGTSSTASLVQDVWPGNDLTPDGGFGPEAINLWRYGGVQYARGIYTYSVRNYSQTDWYAGQKDITMRIYDSQGLRREIIMPTGADDPRNTTRDWKALKITVLGNSRSKRLIYVPSQNVFFNGGNNGSKAGFDW